MKTLKEIKEYLKSLEKEEITSKRGNKYEFVRIEEKILNKLFEYKSMHKAIHIVNDTIIYPIKWYENGKAIEIIVARKEN